MTSRSLQKQERARYVEVNYAKTSLLILFCSTHLHTCAHAHTHTHVPGVILTVESRYIFSSTQHLVLSGVHSQVSGIEFGSDSCGTPRGAFTLCILVFYLLHNKMFYCSIKYYALRESLLYSIMIAVLARSVLLSSGQIPSK